VNLRKNVGTTTAAWRFCRGLLHRFRARQLERDLSNLAPTINARQIGATDMPARLGDYPLSDKQRRLTQSSVRLSVR